ncbi:MAG: alpha/beta hydrolase fold domain-containing protein [Blastopirellula sp. JB062]
MSLRLIFILGIVFFSWYGMIGASTANAADPASRKKCLSVLRAGLRADPFWPAMHAAEALTAIGETSDVKKRLAQQWKTCESDQQLCGLARELVRAGDDSYAGMLSYKLADPNSTGRVHAAESLFKLNRLGDEATLRRAAQSSDRGLRQMALAALARSGDADARRQIVADLRSQDKTARRRAAWFLSVIGAPSDLEPLRAAYRKATDPLEKAQLEHTLATLGDASATAALFENLTSEVAAIRANAAYYAGAARATQAAPALLDLLEDPETDVAIRAAGSWLQLQTDPIKPTPAKAPAKAVDYLRAAAAKMAPDQRMQYATVDGQTLDLHLFQPADWKPTDMRPCLIAIHGGGWSGGEPRRLFPICERFKSRGMVAISIEYRLLNPRKGITVFDSVSDAQRAVRHIRRHADQLGIDPQKIVVCGASAGGHLAVGCALFDQDEEPSKAPQASATPNALALLYPVIDTSPAGYGANKIGDRWRELSPVDHVRAGMPPTILLHGTGDPVTPFAGAKRFDQAMKEAGNRCDFHVNDGGIHGYFMYDLGLYYEALEQLETFFTSLQWLPHDASPE